MCSPIDLDLPPGSRGTDKLLDLPQHHDGIRLRRVAASGGDEETVFPHDSSSDDDADLSDGAEQGQRYQEVIENALKQEINSRMKKRLRKHNAQRKGMEKQLEQKDGEIKMLKDELASKDATIEQKVSELDKQLEEKRKQAVTTRRLEEKLTAVTEDNKCLNATLKDVEAQYHGLIKKHRSDIERLQSSNSYAGSLLEKERNNSREMEAKLQESELALSVSQETSRKKRQEVQRLKDELAVVKASNAQLTKTKQDLQNRIDTLQRELESKTIDLDGIMTASFELTNKLKYVNCKDQRADDDDKESDCRDVDSGIYSVSKDDIDSLPPLTMEVLVDFVEEITPKWDLVGHSLPVGTALIQSLRDQPCNPQSKCTQVLEKWLEESAEVSWSRFIDVLRRQKLNALVSKMIGQLKPKLQ